MYSSYSVFRAECHKKKLLFISNIHFNNEEQITVHALHNVLCEIHIADLAGVSKIVASECMHCVKSHR